jgi:adenylate kinase
MNTLIALTGTPGTGKTSVAALFPRRLRVMEVQELAEWFDAATGRGRTTVVDLRRLLSSLDATTDSPVDVIVGHLAHLLPVSRVIVLRCHPNVLMQRLVRARRGSAKERYENYVTEATDLVLQESIRPERKIWEVDTTGRSARATAATVIRRLRADGPSRYGNIDWLADPRVTEHLLDGQP